MVTDKYVTIPKLAELLGLSRIAVYKKVKSGQIPAARVGKMYVISDRTIAQILGRKLTSRGRRQIEAAVRKTVREYGEALRRLGTE